MRLSPTRLGGTFKSISSIGPRLLSLAAAAAPGHYGSRPRIKQTGILQDFKLRSFHFIVTIFSKNGTLALDDDCLKNYS